MHIENLIAGQALKPVNARAVGDKLRVDTSLSEAMIEIVASSSLLLAGPQATASGLALPITPHILAGGGGSGARGGGSSSGRSSSSRGSSSMPKSGTGVSSVGTRVGAGSTVGGGLSGVAHAEGYALSTLALLAVTAAYLSRRVSS